MATFFAGPDHYAIRSHLFAASLATITTLFTIACRILDAGTGRRGPTLIVLYFQALSSVLSGCEYEALKARYLRREEHRGFNFPRREEHARALEFWPLGLGLFANYLLNSTDKRWQSDDEARQYYPDSRPR
jgi:hypothetical protein